MFNMISSFLDLYSSMDQSFAYYMTVWVVETCIKLFAALILWAFAYKRMNFITCILVACLAFAIWENILYFQHVFNLFVLVYRSTICVWIHCMMFVLVKKYWIIGLLPSILIHWSYDYIITHSNWYIGLLFMLFMVYVAVTVYETIFAHIREELSK